MGNLKIFQLAVSQPWLRALLIFSLFGNVLLLIPSWYMLEVYDRVVMSRNIVTLVMLALLSLVLLWVMELINHVRQDVMLIQSKQYITNKKSLIFDCAMFKSVKNNQPINATDIEQVNTVAQFIASPLLLALIDLPFALIFLVLIYCMSIPLGHLTLVIALAVACISWLNELGIHENLQQANRLVAQSQSILNNIIRNSEVIQAMNMRQSLQGRWLSKHFEYLKYQSQASMTAGTFQSISRLLQQLLGSAILGIGAWLLLEGNLSVGASGLIVGSILATRFITPFVQIVSGWKSIITATDAYSNIQKLEEDYTQEISKVELPPPTGQLNVENVNVTLPVTGQAIVKQVNFALKPGQSLALIGPSGSGKTTLAKLIVGGLKADSGCVRLDGADIFAWNKASVGGYLGYMPQEIEFYDGTIAQNIARFEPVVDEAEVAKALEMVGLTDYIQSLPEGMHTKVEAGGGRFPGGKRQLMALARAIYKTPKLVFLDEPSSNLDVMGEVALKRTIAYLRQQQTTLVMATHHKEYLTLVDFIIVMVNGEARLSGPTKDVLEKLASKPPIAQQQKEVLK